MSGCTTAGATQAQPALRARWSLRQVTHARRDLILHRTAPMLRSSVVVPASILLDHPMPWH